MKKRRIKNSITEDHWGKRLQKILNEKEISIRELSRNTNVSPSVVSGWIKGNSPNDLILIKSICEFLGVSFSWLLTGEHEQTNNVPNIHELFTEQQYFDGYARIRIDRLLPIKTKNK